MNSANEPKDYTRGPTIIAQFPAEILERIIDHLHDPIWIFQAELAFPEVASFLQSPAANRIWYDLLPAALLTLPEYFQSEMHVAYAQSRSAQKHYAVSSINFSTAVVASSEMLSTRTSDYAQETILTTISYTLPSLTRVSDLELEVEAHGDTKHPKSGSLHQYPVVKPNLNKTRKRILALGGPFDTTISYRREILGHLHQKERCFSCYEHFSGGIDRGHPFGANFCGECVLSLVLKDNDVTELRGLRVLLNRARLRAFGMRDQLSYGGRAGYWIPAVDELLRKEIGIDYKTAVAKQLYFTYLWQAPRPRSLAKGREQRDVRNLLVGEVKRLWDNPSCLDKDFTTILLNMRSRFAPTSKLAEFLFPDHLLYEDAVYFPHDTKAKWLLDPVSTVSDDLLNTLVNGPSTKLNAWLNVTARVLIIDLLLHKNVTKLIEAAEEWHVQRLRADLQDYEKIMTRALAEPPKNRANRLRVILEKLHLLTGDINYKIGLNAGGEALAKRVLPGLIEKACIACPHSWLLSPRGIEGVVKHMREVHPGMFWKGDFLIQG